jgi:hypothetical protein
MVLRDDQGKQPKRVLCVRVSETGYRHIADRADRADVPVSHMARRMLAYASTHMPATWVPERGAR